MLKNKKDKIRNAREIYLKNKLIRDRCQRKTRKFRIKQLEQNIVFRNQGMKQCAPIKIILRLPWHQRKTKTPLNHNNYNKKKVLYFPDIISKQY